VRTSSRRPVGPGKSFCGVPGAGAPREAILNQSLKPDPLLDGVRVLVVDDHPVVREVIAELLEDFGARVTAVSGVPEAIESLERERPNVMLSDIEMPGEDGYALIRKVRALPPDRGGQTPAAALTGLGTSADRARALQAGFQDHVAKPVDAGQLVRIVTILAAKR
jgi:CheY-like chemotaxis protein